MGRPEQSFGERFSTLAILVPAIAFADRVDFGSRRSTYLQSRDRMPDAQAAATSSLDLGATTMRFMMLLKADKNTEAGLMPDEAILIAMGKYNEELIKAGVLLAGEGLQPSSKGARVRFAGGKTTVIDGPFAETKELIAGFWMIQAKSKEEAIEWAKRAPNPSFGGKTNIEIRQVITMEDFGDAATPE